jgi:hypothetical protein
MTVLIAFSTINEMRRQRTHSYFPDLNISDFDFYVYRGDFDEEISNIELHSFKERKEEGAKISGFNELEIDIKNIGFGVAKNIRCEWSFNLERAKELICKNESVLWNGNENAILVESKPLNYEYSIDVRNNFDRKFNFILPYSDEGKESKIVIPDHYINLYWLYVTNKSIYEIKQKPIENNFPFLELNIEYTDMHLSKLTKTFVCQLKHLLIDIPDGIFKEIAILRFEIEEKKKLF